MSNEEWLVLSKADVDKMLDHLGRIKDYALDGREHLIPVVLSSIASTLEAAGQNKLTINAEECRSAGSQPVSMVEGEANSATRQARLIRYIGYAIEGKRELIKKLFGGNAPEDIQNELDSALALHDKLDALKAAISKHHSQKADDRCILDDDELYKAAGLSPVDRRVGDKEAMLANCARFIERRCEAGGWPTYVELEQKIKALEERLFPIMDGPAIPWSAIAPYESRAKKNHGQSLQRLAERGGLSCGEALAVLEDRPWTPQSGAEALLHALLEKRMEQ